MGIIDTVTSNKLSKELIGLETIVRTTQKAFIPMGKALTEINNYELYKDRGFKTWDDYVNVIFDMSRAYAYKIMNAYAVIEILKDFGYTGQALPKTESQARPMAALLTGILVDGVYVDASDKIKEAWTAVIADGKKVTAARVTAAVNKAIGKAEPKKVDPAKDKTESNTALDILDKANTTGTTDTTHIDNDTDILNQEYQATLEDQVKEQKAQIMQLESQLLKAQKVRSNVPRSKMAIELYKAGFKALAASTTAEQMDELMNLKTSLIGS